MARHNEVTMYGQVSSAPKINTDKPGQPDAKKIQVICTVAVIRGIRDYGAMDHRIKMDNPIVLSQNAKIMKQMAKWEKGDMVLIRGTLLVFPDLLSGFILADQDWLGDHGGAVRRDLCPESLTILVLVDGLGRQNEARPGCFVLRILVWDQDPGEFPAVFRGERFRQSLAELDGYFLALFRRFRRLSFFGFFGHLGLRFLDEIRHLYIVFYCILRHLSSSFVGLIIVRDAEDVLRRPRYGLYREYP